MSSDELLDGELKHGEMAVSTEWQHWFFFIKNFAKLIGWYAVLRDLELSHI